MNRIRTTVVGSYPKPDYLDIPNWFDGNEALYNPDTYTKYLQNNDLTEKLVKARKEVIDEQIELGLDVITDGELHRENYIHYFCRHLEGISFDQLSKKKIRENGITSTVPTIINRLSLNKFASEIEWDKDNKITLPGPMTILDTVVNEHYREEKLASRDISRALRAEILNLVELGCRHIQIDEPIMARNVSVALDYGIQHLEFCLKDLPCDVERTLHICCGYPNFLDQDDYVKADKNAYHKLAKRLDNSPAFDIISIEHAEADNNLSLFKLFQNKTIQLGTVCSARSRIESVSEIEARIREVLNIIKDPNRLIVSPDCGLGMLPRKIAYQKLANMVKAVRNINDSLLQ